MTHFMPRITILSHFESQMFYESYGAFLMLFHLCSIILMVSVASTYMT